MILLLLQVLLPATVMRRMQEGIHGGLHGGLVGRIPALDEQDVGHDFCAGVLLEGGIRQADGANQITLHCQAGPVPRIFCIHQVARHNHDLQAAGCHSIQRPLEELIVDGHAA